MNLIITITNKSETDYDGNLTDFREVGSAIDGKSTRVISSYPSDYTDLQCEDAHKAELTAFGFTWNN